MAGPEIAKLIGEFKDEPGDLPQHASDIDTVVKQLFTESGTNTDGLPIRDLLGLDEALSRHRSAFVDNLAKLHELDADIANAEHELDGEEAATDPAKKVVLNSF